MTELKTLKDFRCQAEHCCDRDNCNNQSIKVDNLRQEAIKWIKELSLIKESVMSQDYRDGKMDMLRAFFNITEEELKEQGK